MLRSLEIRWFYGNTVPNSVIHWFEADLPGKIPLTPEPSREDYYLSLKETDSLGIKLSRNRLQIKRRTKTFDFFLEGGTKIGRAEYWIRLDLYDKLPKRELLPLLARFDWILVNKGRIQRKYKFLKNALVQVPSIQLDPDCAIEITKLTLNNMSSWTMAVEVFDIGHLTSKRLSAAVKILLSRYPLNLDLTDSYSYPGWLLAQTVE